MGKINKGILGGFNGKVGTVVGGSWKGISYMRSLAQSITKSRSGSQVKQRTKFALALRFLQPILSFVRAGFKPFAIHQSSYNAAMSYTMRNGIKGEFPEYKLDYEHTLVSRGSLTPAENASAAVAEGKVTFKWKDNSGIGSAAETDYAMPLVLNTTKRIAVYTDRLATRKDATVALELPTDWKDDSIEAYLSFRALDSKVVANSVHLLSVTGTNKPAETKPATGGDTKPSTGGGTNTGETGIGG